MTTTAPTTVTVHGDGTFDIGGNLFRLDALIDGYEAILKQATDQLQKLDVTDEQLERIANMATGNLDYYRLARAMATETATNDELKPVIANLADAVGRRIDEDRIKNLIRQELDELVTAKFNDLLTQINLRFDRLIESEAAAARNEARASTRMFEELFRTVFGDDIKQQIQKQARTLAEEMTQPKSEAQ